MEGIKSNYHTLQVLKTAGPKLRNAIVSNCKNDLLKVIKESALNLLRGKVILKTVRRESYANAEQSSSRLLISAFPYLRRRGH
jgi:hypothetical protein